MIQAIRDRITGWFALLIVFMLAFVVGIWGIASYFAPTVENFVAKVGDEEITANDYQTRLSRYRDQMRGMMGEGFDPRTFEEATFKRDFVDGLVRQRLLQQNAAAAGLVAPVNELQQQISEIPAFQIDGKFNQEAYRNLLRQQNLTPTGFDRLLREEAEVNRLPESLRLSAFATDADTDLIAKLRDQKRTVRFFEISGDALRQTLKPTDAEIKTFYDGHPTDFMSIETAQLDYVELKAERYAAEVVITEDTLKQRYETEKARFGTSERRLASHILVATEANATAEQQKVAADKAASILKRIRDGEKFADVAKSVSDDPGSKEQGGDLGFIEQNGTMEKPFEEALFALTAKGDITEPVSTRFGYHIIELRDIEASRQKAFAEVKDQLEQEDRKEQSERKFLDASGEVVDETISDPSTLEGVAKKFSLKIETLDGVTRAGGAGIAGSPDLIEAAFSEDVLKSGYNSRPIMITPDHMVIVRLKNLKPSVRQKLEEVRAQVVSRVIEEKVTQQIREQAKALGTRAKAGEPLDELLKSAPSAALNTPGEIGRSGAPVDPQLLTEIFKLDAPKGDKPSVTEISFAEGRRFAVVELSAVVDGDPKKLSSDEREQLKEQIAGAASSAEISAMVAALRAKTEIVVKDDML